MLGQILISNADSEFLVWETVEGGGNKRWLEGERIRRDRDGMICNGTIRIYLLNGEDASSRLDD